MALITILLYAGLTILGVVTALWLLSLVLRDSSIVDVFWGVGFVGVYWVTGMISDAALSPRGSMLGVLVTTWGLRLAAHVLLRNAGKGEDFRYAAWREQHGQHWWWRSYLQVFLLQGLLMWIVALPLIVVRASNADGTLNWLDYAAAALWAIGFVFEAGGDLQLSLFKSDPANRGRILSTGLWSLTRHPNYFGDAAQWWAFYLVAVAAGGTWTIVSPALMTFLLLRVSGVSLLEQSLQRRKPGYAEYAARTPAFFPWFPKKQASKE